MSDIFFKSFDHHKYIRIHNDLQNKQLNTKERCWNHFKKYGWREGRHNCFKDPHLFDKYSNSKLINIYQTDMKSGLQKIDRFVNFSSNIEKKIHIIIRTHLREDYFQRAIESIREQDYQNYIIHVAYDHPDSLKYIKKYVGEKMMVHQVIRKSPENAFFDLYCNDVKGKINNGWIMFLDDDNQLTHPKCLKIINEYLQKKKKIVVWSFLRPGRVIKPQLDKLRYGDIDNCSYIFHHSIKNCGQFGDFYGSDFQFVESLLTKHKSVLISFILVSTQYNDKISHFVDYDNLEEELFTDLERIDFDDYKNHYQDLQHLSIKKLKKHYDNHGKHESRIIKFLDFDYNLFKKSINHYLTYYKSCLRFTIITTLYNETNTVRLF